MKTLSDIGELALGTRFKRLSDYLYAAVDKAYELAGLDFQSRWFPVVYLLKENGLMGITELAEHLGQTHSAISQLSRKMLAKGIVEEANDPADTRRRLLRLSPEGEAVVENLLPFWSDIELAVREVINRSGFELMQVLERFENELTRQPLSDLIMQRRQLRETSLVEIIDYDARYRDDFKRLNEEWLTKYFYVEELDQKVLSDPETHILRNGGKIFFARFHGKIIGTCALINHGEQMELSKMAVTEQFQGLKVGRRLLEWAIIEFKSSDKKCLFLETNSRLLPAIHLYERMGFVRQDAPKADSHYKRADVYMLFQG